MYQHRAKGVNMSQGKPLEEYREVGENIRHWQSMRFISMTVFIGIMAGLLAALFQWTGTTPSLGRVFLRIVGVVVVVIAFWIMDERIVWYWQCFLYRAITLVFIFMGWG
jgi:membrane associated rhomboid family serine protease